MRLLQVFLSNPRASLMMERYCRCFTWLICVKTVLLILLFSIDRFSLRAPQLFSQTSAGSRFSMPAPLALSASTMSDSNSDVMMMFDDQPAPMRCVGTDTCFGFLFLSRKRCQELSTGLVHKSAAHCLGSCYHCRVVGYSGQYRKFLIS